VRGRATRQAVHKAATLCTPAPVPTDAVPVEAAEIEGNADSPEAAARQPGGDAVDTLAISFRGLLDRDAEASAALLERNAVLTSALARSENEARQAAAAHLGEQTVFADTLTELGELQQTHATALSEMAKLMEANAALMEANAALRAAPPPPAPAPDAAAAGPQDEVQRMTARLDAALAALASASQASTNAELDSLRSELAEQTRAASAAAAREAATAAALAATRSAAQYWEGYAEEQNASFASVRDAAAAAADTARAFADASESVLATTPETAALREQLQAELSRTESELAALVTE
jgi:hypothetical protein